MSEIKRPVLRLTYGQEHIAGHSDYVITEEHTIADIARFIVERGWEEDLTHCIDEIVGRTGGSDGK